MLAVDVECRLGAFRLAASFSAGAGVTALFGRSGAGKTSVVNAIAGILRPQRGRIAVDGEVFFDSACGIDLPPPRRRVGYVFQEGRLFPHLSVRQNLLYARLFSRKRAALGDLDRVVALLGLEHLLERRPGNLSGGERQRVAIGRALLSQPRLLLLDEPLAGLDSHRRSEILQYIELMLAELRIPVVYVSHAVEEVVRLADTVVLMSAGQVIAAGSVEDIMGRPDLRPAGGIFEGGAVIDAKVIEQDIHDDLATLAFDGGTLVATGVDALVGEPVRVRIRARDVAIALDPPSRTSIQNVLRGNIVRLETGAEGSVDVTVAVGRAMLRSRVTRRSVEQLALAPGMDVYLLIKAVALDRRSTGT